MQRKEALLKYIGIFLISFCTFYLVFGLIFNFDDREYLFKISLPPTLATVLVLLAITTGNKVIREKHMNIIPGILLLTIICSLQIFISFGSVISLIRTISFGAIFAIIIHSLIHLQFVRYPPNIFGIVKRSLLNFIISSVCALVIYLSLLSPATTKEDSLFLQGLFTTVISLPFIVLLWTFLMHFFRPKQRHG